MSSVPRKLALSLVVAAAFTGGYALHDQIGLGAHAAEPAGATVAAAPLALEGQAGNLAAIGRRDFSDIVSAQGPAVVNISVSGTTKTSMAMPEFDPNGPFGEFFRRFGVPGMPGHGGGMRQMPTHGLGSGFIVSSDGVILTNAHVVADADTVTVKLNDRREFKAKVVGIDKQTDVAVLRIDAKDLPTVKIGDPARARVGEWVVAIGSPFGFDNTVTAGIISAKSRTLPDEGYVPFMQTDVAVNPGNSGGPLINTSGEVIGINSQIYSRSGGYQGLSFAIPIDVAMNVEQQLIAHGKVSRGRLGIMVQEVDQGLADSFGLDRPRGALVSSVDADSPAAKAGLEPGDVILSFNGKEIGSSSELPVLVGSSAPGSKASLEIWRKGASKTLALSIGEMDNARLAADDASDEVSAGKLGLALRPLTREEKAQVAGGEGLVVEQVADGPAAQAGIKRGDVILSANGESVTSVEQLRGKLGHSGKQMALLIQRGDRRLFVPIRIG